MKENNIYFHRKFSPRNFFQFSSALKNVEKLQPKLFEMQLAAEQ